MEGYVTTPNRQEEDKTNFAVFIVDLVSATDFTAPSFFPLAQKLLRQFLRSGYSVVTFALSQTLGSKRLSNAIGVVHPKLQVFPVSGCDKLLSAVQAHVTRKPRFFLQTARLCHQENGELLKLLRDTFGVQSYICGFETERAIEKMPIANIKSISLQQVLDTRINLMVFTDLLRLEKEKKIIFATTPEGGTLPFSGNYSSISRKLYKFITKREAVSWFRTAHQGECKLTKEERTQNTFKSASLLLQFAIDTHLLTSHPGNISFRFPSPSPLRPSNQVGFLVTPRKVDKSKLTPQELVRAEADISSVAIKCWCSPDRKSSIDSGVQAILYNRLPHIHGFLHFHYNFTSIIVPDLQTTFNYPCGTVEEADDIVYCLSQKILEKKIGAQSGFMVDMIHHGYLLALKQKGAFELINQWKQICEAFKTKHIKQQMKNLPLKNHNSTTNSNSDPCIEIKAKIIADLDENYTFHPIFLGPVIVGLIAQQNIFMETTLYLSKEHRTEKLKNYCMKELETRNITLVVFGSEFSKHSIFAQRKGWKVVKYDCLQNTTYLRFESLQEPGTPSWVSICLLNPATNCVLLKDNGNGRLSLPGSVVQAHKKKEELRKITKLVTKEVGIEMLHHKKPIGCVEFLEYFNTSELGFASNGDDSEFPCKHHLCQGGVYSCSSVQTHVNCYGFLVFTLGSAGVADVDECSTSSGDEKKKGKKSRRECYQWVHESLLPTRLTPNELAALDSLGFLSHKKK